MEKHLMKTKGMSSMKYGTSSQYFTLVLHHGGFMVNSPRNRHMHVFLEEEVVALKPHIETTRNELDQPVRTDTDIRTKSVEPVTTKTDIRIESVEPVTTETDVRTKLEDDSEDLDYVFVDSTDCDSGFEESDNDMTDEEGFARDVNVGINHEMDINNLINDLLGGLPAITLDDENVGFDELHSASDSDSNSEFTKIRKVRCLELNVESDSLNPQFEKRMIFGDKDTLKHSFRQYGIKNREQYSMIYDYLREIRKTNPGNTTILMLDDRVFLRMYICLQACKDGYKAGCRHVLSIDGCHLKGYYGGTFLAAVVVDANDSIYPIAYDVVEAKNQSSWSWFLSLLGTDLEIGNTYVKEFEDAIAELKALSAPAFDWLKRKDPEQWSKSHFSPRSKCDMLLINLSECFNKVYYLLQICIF
ncbi:hypothetical protein GQ457_08G016010 [Hibiscus cannabinus]